MPIHIVADFYAEPQGWNPYNQANTERRLAEMRCAEEERAQEEQNRINLWQGLVHPQVDFRTMVRKGHGAMGLLRYRGA